MSDREERPSLSAEDQALLERVVPPLRSGETLEPGFEARVMAVARAEAPARYPKAAPWWRRPRTLRLSPVAGLGLAAGFAGLVAVGTLAAGRLLPNPPAAAQAAAADTVHLVRFVLAAPDAQSVQLVGDFNAWSRDATPLAVTAVEGVWTVTVPLAPGRHEYAFIVDGEHWVADSTARIRSDEFGTETSVVRVGSGA
jgi:hypothetical protein